MSDDFTDLPQYDEYRESFVAFLDLLGFTDEIREIKSEEQFQRAAYTLYAFSKESERLSTAPPPLSELQITAVSDSIIATMPVTGQAGLPGLLSVLHEFQYTLVAKYQRPLRGYLAKGPVLHRPGILLGGGYLDAYDGESKGGPPRIALSEKLAQYCADAVANVPEPSKYTSAFDYLRQDTDGAYFVDYLRPLAVAANQAPEESVADRARVRALITQRLVDFKDDPSIRSKYEWLDDYYEQTKPLWPL